MHTREAHKHEIGMGQSRQYLSIKTISAEPCDDTLQWAPQLSAHVVMGEFEISKTNPKSDEIVNLHPIILYILRLL